MKNFLKRLFGIDSQNGIFAPKTSGRGALILPSWARVAKQKVSRVSICIEADTAGYIAEWFELLGVKETTQYWLEVAYQCAKLDLQAALVGTEFDPRTSKQPAEFHFSRAPEWAQVRFPAGRGLLAASKGGEARGYYKKVRGALPF